MTQEEIDQLKIQIEALEEELAPKLAQLKKLKARLRKEIKDQKIEYSVEKSPVTLELDTKTKAVLEDLKAAFADF